MANFALEMHWAKPKPPSIYYQTLYAKSDKFFKVLSSASSLAIAITAIASSGLMTPALLTIVGCGISAINLYKSYKDNPFFIIDAAKGAFENIKKIVKFVKGLIFGQDHSLNDSNSVTLKEKILEVARATLYVLSLATCSLTYFIKNAAPYLGLVSASLNMLLALDYAFLQPIVIIQQLYSRIIKIPIINKFIAFS